MSTQSDLDNPVHEAGVHVDNKNANKCHLFPRVLKYEVRIIGFTAKAIWCHHHRQVASIHLSHGSVLSRSKHLQTTPVKHVIGTAEQGLCNCQASDCPIWPQHAAGAGLLL